MTSALSSLEGQIIEERQERFRAECEIWDELYSLKALLQKLPGAHLEKLHQNQELQKKQQLDRRGRSQSRVRMRAEDTASPTKISQLRDELPKEMREDLGKQLAETLQALKGLQRNANLRLQEMQMRIETLEKRPISQQSTSMAREKASWQEDQSGSTRSEQFVEGEVVSLHELVLEVHDDDLLLPLRLAKLCRLALLSPQLSRKERQLALQTLDSKEHLLQTDKRSDSPFDWEGQSVCSKTSRNTQSL